MRTYHIIVYERGEMALYSERAPKKFSEKKISVIISSGRKVGQKEK